MQLKAFRSLNSRFARRLARFGLILSFTFAFAESHADERIKVQLKPRRAWDFGDVHFSNEFSGGRLADCARIDANAFLGVITPENQPINQSPWYAFKVWSTKSKTISLTLTNTYSPQRGRPWLSRDGVKWERIRDSAYDYSPKSRTAVLRLKVGARPLWVATQETIGLKELGAWTERKAALPFAKSSVIGQSIEGRPLRQFVLSETTNANFIFIIGRQHPPEVTGSIGLMSFVDTLAGNSRLAKRFRREFQTVVIPLVNPDGVEHGHWRSNLGAIDLNRDWGPFNQPESRATSEAIMKFAREPDARSFAFIDFHSTHTNIFYAQPDEQKLFPEQFTRRWIAAIHERLPQYGFERDNGHNTKQPTSKAWANETLGIASITWEFGYATDRKTIRRVAQVGAEELMRLLLEDARKSPAAFARK